MFLESGVSPYIKLLKNLPSSISGRGSIDITKKKEREREDNGKKN